MAKVWFLKLKLSTTLLRDLIVSYQIIKKAYEYLNLIIPKSKLSDALDLVDEEIGIITYTTKNKHVLFETYKEPKYNHHIEPLFQLDQLTKNN
jgi:hypothetical protein